MTRLHDLDPTAPRGHLYSVLDSPEHRTHGIEVECGDFLYGLVRAEKPRLVLESGTGFGGSTGYIARALEANGLGALITYESNPEFAGASQSYARTDYRIGSTLDYSDAPFPDLVFLDSAPLKLRIAEVEYWLLQPVILAVHDYLYHSELAEVLQGGVVLNLPRGLWLRTAFSLDNPESRREIPED